jgi:formiminotetrahydrofolate cyclodeaminase
VSRDFLSMPVQEFLGEVATPEPMPGAGYCAAVSLSMAAGLVAMVAGASRTDWSEAKGAAAQANTLRERVAPLAQRNVDAYASAIARLRAAEYAEDAPSGHVPGSDPSQDLGPLLDRAAQIPMEIAEAAVDVAALAAVVAERGDQALRADAVAAALLAQGAARAAATLVEVNLGTTESDSRVVRVRDLAGAAQAASDRAVATLA